MLKVPIDSKLVYEMLNSNLLNPNGFLYGYVGKDVNYFFEKLAKERELLGKLKDLGIELQAFEHEDALSNRCLVAENAHDPMMTYYAFAYLAGIDLNQIESKVKQSYRDTCTNLQELRDYVLNELVPRIEEDQREVGSQYNYNYSSIVPLDKLKGTFDKDVASGISIAFEQLIKRMTE